MTQGHELRGWGGCWWERVYRMEGNKGGEWDNCNSIINKIYFKNINSPLKNNNKIKSHSKICDQN